MAIASRVFAQHQPRHKHHHRRRHHHHLHSHHSHHMQPLQQQPTQEQQPLAACSTTPNRPPPEPSGDSTVGSSPSGRRLPFISPWQPLAAGAVGLQQSGGGALSDSAAAGSTFSSGERITGGASGGCLPPATVPAGAEQGGFARSCSSLSGKLGMAQLTPQPPNSQQQQQRTGQVSRETGSMRGWGRQLSSGHMSDIASAVPHSPHGHMGAGGSSPHLLLGRPVSMTLVASSRAATDAPQPPHSSSSSSSIAGQLHAGGCPPFQHHHTSLPSLLPGSCSVEAPVAALPPPQLPAGAPHSGPLDGGGSHAVPHTCFGRYSMGGPGGGHGTGAREGGGGGSSAMYMGGAGQMWRPAWANSDSVLGMGSKARAAVRSSGNLVSTAACGGGGLLDRSSMQSGGLMQAEPGANGVGEPGAGGGGPGPPPSLGACSSSHNLLYSSLGRCSSQGNISNSSAGGSTLVRVRRRVGGGGRGRV